MTSRARQLLCDTDPGMCGPPEQSGSSNPLLDDVRLTPPKTEGSRVIPPPPATKYSDDPYARQLEQVRDARAATEKFVDSIFGKLDIDGNRKLSVEELQNEQSREKLSDDEKRFVDWSEKNYDLIRETSGTWSIIPRRGMFELDGITPSALTGAARLNEKPPWGGNSGSDWFRSNHINSVHFPEKYAMGAGTAVGMISATEVLPALFPRLRHPTAIALAGAFVAGVAIEKVLDYRWGKQFDAKHGLQVTKMQNDLRQLNLPMARLYPDPIPKAPKSPMQKLPYSPIQSRP